MNNEWSEKNKRIQILLAKEATYKDGIELLVELRREMFEQITQIANGYPAEAFYQMPFANAKGYHSKTLAYSIWHIFRIEDIVAHTLIAKDEQIIVIGEYQKKSARPSSQPAMNCRDRKLQSFQKNSISRLYMNMPKKLCFLPTHFLQNCNIRR